MCRIEQAVLRELGMKLEADEAALQTAEAQVRNEIAKIQIERRIVLVIELIEEAARIIGESSTVRKIPHIARLGPTYWRSADSGIECACAWKPSKLLDANL